MSDAQAVWLPLGTALIGAMAGVAGSLIATLLASSKSHEQWVRDKRASALERYYVVQDQAERFVSRLTEGGAPQPDGTMKVAPYKKALAEEVFNHLVEAATTAGLYVSAELNELITTIAYDFQVVAFSIETFNGDEWRTTRNGWRDDLRRAYVQMRHELDVD